METPEATTPHWNRLSVSQRQTIRGQMLTHDRIRWIEVGVTGRAEVGLSNGRILTRLDVGRRGKLRSCTHEYDR